MSKTLIPVDTGRKEPYLLEITRQDAEIRGLPDALHGALFAHVTDLHGGFGNTDPVYDAAIAQINAAQPDFILFTGDYIDDHCRNDRYPMAELLRRFEAKRGKFGCFGNHDHRRGVVGTRRVVEQGGVQVLNNENICLEPGLWLAGCDDLGEGQPDLDRTFAGVPDDVTVITLSHHPRMIELVPQRDALILSGHTHGAQFALKFPNPRMVCWLHLRCRQVAGWYRNGRAREYVSRGVGVTGKPYRIHCPAEVVLFRLVPHPDKRSAQPAAERLPEPAHR